MIEQCYNSVFIDFQYNRNIYGYEIAYISYNFTGGN